MRQAAFPELADMDYAPLVVVPITPQLNPSPSALRTALFAFAEPPYCWLDIGTPVHLHLPNAPTTRPGPCRCPRVPQEKEPLAIRGWVVAESARTASEVEYVVTNEEVDAPVQRAIVQFRLCPRFPLPPNLAELNARRPGATEQQMARNSGCRTGVDGPPERADSAPRGEVNVRKRRPKQARAESSPRPRAQGPPSLGGARRMSGPMTMDLQHLRDPSRSSRGVATQPYAMIERYGAAALPHAMWKEEQGIWNYGRPIVVRAKEAD